MDSCYRSCLNWHCDHNQFWSTHSLQLPQGRSDFVPSRQLAKFLRDPGRPNCTLKSQEPLKGQRVKGVRFYKHDVHQTWLYTFAIMIPVSSNPRSKLGSALTFLHHLSKRVVITFFYCIQQPAVGLNQWTNVHKGSIIGCTINTHSILLLFCWRSLSYFTGWKCQALIKPGHETQSLQLRCGLENQPWLIH